ncbi:M15 family metallopeptidase [Gracilinema caldarium]|nr:M15 family metallopeptidase [Gracilinema caldarium]
MMKIFRYIILSFFVLMGCIPVSAQKRSAEAELKLQKALEAAKVPLTIQEKLLYEMRANPENFIKAITTITSQDHYLWRLVDKHHALDTEYEPSDLVTLTSGSYLLNRSGLQLRKSASLALNSMAQAAKVDGVTLVVSSCYRSYQYQKQVYERNVKTMGQAAADRESAKPGHSQHQLGLAVDFGSIDDSFAKTAQSRWLEQNAWRYGWSLSYPENMESVTGYRWESWHYRFVGVELSLFIRTYFENIQQYALAFLHYYTAE